MRLTLCVIKEIAGLAHVLSGRWDVRHVRVCSSIDLPTRNRECLLPRMLPIQQARADDVDLEQGQYFLLSKNLCTTIWRIREDGNQRKAVGSISDQRHAMFFAIFCFHSKSLSFPKVFDAIG